MICNIIIYLRNDEIVPNYNKDKNEIFLEINNIFYISGLIILFCILSKFLHKIRKNCIF